MSAAAKENDNDKGRGGSEITEEDEEKREKIHQLEKTLGERFVTLQEPFLDDIMPNTFDKYMLKLKRNAPGGITIFASLAAAIPAFFAVRRFGPRRLYKELAKDIVVGTSSKDKMITSFLTGSISVGIFLSELGVCYWVGRTIQKRQLDASTKMRIIPLRPCAGKEEKCEEYCQIIINDLERILQTDEIKNIQKLNVVNKKTNTHSQQQRGGDELQYFVEHAKLCRQRFEYQNWVRKTEGLPADSIVPIPEPMIPPFPGFMQSIADALSEAKTSSSNKILKQEDRAESSRSWSANNLVKDREEGFDNKEEK